MKVPEFSSRHKSARPAKQDIPLGGPQRRVPFIGRLPAASSTYINRGSRTAATNHRDQSPIPPRKRHRKPSVRQPGAALICPDDSTINTGGRRARKFIRATSACATAISRPLLNCNFTTYHVYRVGARCTFTRCAHDQRPELRRQKDVSPFSRIPRCFPV